MPKFWVILAIDCKHAESPSLKPKPRRSVVHICQGSRKRYGRNKGIKNGNGSLVYDYEDLCKL